MQFLERGIFQLKLFLIQICNLIYENFSFESGLAYTACSQDLHITLWEEILDLEACKFVVERHHRRRSLLLTVKDQI